MNEFKLGNRNCRVVQPKKTAPGRPWIWRARFWGHEPQTDLALLEKGWHLTYSDAKPVRLSSGRCPLGRLLREDDERAWLGKESRPRRDEQRWVDHLQLGQEEPGQNSMHLCRRPGSSLRELARRKRQRKRLRRNLEKCLQAYGLTENEAKTFRGLPLRPRRLGQPESALAPCRRPGRCRRAGRGKHRFV